MSSTWGSNIKITIFGESHGKGVGIVIDGLPAGFELNMEIIEKDMRRRAPGQSEISTARKEEDKVEILSGIFREKTTGAPLCGFIRNTDARSEGYDCGSPRPGSADLTAFMKYNGYNDFRGSGHFSGRMTAPLTFAGSIARQILSDKGIEIAAHILQIGDIKDTSFEEAGLTIIDKQILNLLIDSDFPLLNKNVKQRMTQSILNAKEEKDSVGGVIECAAIGLPPGLGSPFFESVESSIASLTFSVPGVKGISFGSGFGFALLKGSQANDEIYFCDGQFRTRTNHDGGINGGITNGMPLILQTVIRPTASIGLAQNTVNLKTGESEKISISGRHDPCIVPRAVVVIESILAICILDCMSLGN